MVVKVSKETKLYEPVVHKVRDIANKMAILDREVKYLLNKAKIWRPKEESVKLNKTEDTNSEKKSNNSESDESDETIEMEEATIELPESDKMQSEVDSEESKDEHQEL